MTYTTPQIQTMIRTAAARYGVDPAVALAVASHESGFNPAATHQNANGTTDWGVMQLNDTTVKTLGVADPLDPAQNVDAGVRLLAQYQTQYGDTNTALWAYASGPGTVAAGGSPNPTASSFIDWVTQNVAGYSGSGGGGTYYASAGGTADTGGDTPAPTLLEALGLVPTSTGGGLGMVGEVVMVGLGLWMLASVFGD